MFYKENQKLMKDSDFRIFLSEYRVGSHFENEDYLLNLLADNTLMQA